ncbi:MAG: hypothetical protein GKS04_01155 [Candidatus Mycalebacterium zealandia]|nr:MAG: hypothetical protein GKS04_01155 [Candidatus Mycalebacterium zealandia]
MRFVFFLIIFLFADFAHSDDTDTGVSVGNTTIILSSPEGFVSLSEQSHRFIDMDQNFTGGDVRLVGFFVLKSEVEIAEAGGALTRYMLVKTNREFEFLNITREHFSQLSSVFKKQSMESLYNQYGKEMVEEKIESLRRQYGQKWFESFVGPYLNPEFSRLYADEKNFIGSLALYGGKAVCGVNIIRANNKLLYVYVYDLSGDKRDNLDWVLRTSKNWVRNIISRNPSVDTTNKTFTSSMSRKEIFGKAVGKGIASGFFVMIILFVYFFFRKN